MIIGGPAARVSDMHTCPMVTGIIPHVGGPIMPPGIAPLVLVGGLPIATQGQPCLCIGPFDLIATGVFTVRVHGMAAATLGSLTAHGGVVTTGFIPVEIGATFAALAGLGQWAMRKAGVGGAKTVATRAGSEILSTADELSPAFVSNWINRADLTPDQLERLAAKDLAKLTADSGWDGAKREGVVWSTQQIAKDAAKQTKLPLRHRIAIAIQNPRLTYRKMFPRTQDLYDAPLDAAGGGLKGSLKELGGSVGDALRNMPADLRKSFTEYMDAWRGRFGFATQGDPPLIQPSIRNAIADYFGKHTTRDGRLAPWMSQPFEDAVTAARRRMAGKLFSRADLSDLPPETLDRLSRRLGGSSGVGTGAVDGARLSLRERLIADGLVDEVPNPPPYGFFERTGDTIRALPSYMREGLESAGNKIGDGIMPLRRWLDENAELRRKYRQLYDEPSIGEMVRHPIDSTPKWLKSKWNRAEDAWERGRRDAWFTYQFDQPGMFHGPAVLLGSDFGRVKLGWLAYYRMRGAGKSAAKSVVKLPGKIAGLPADAAGFVKSRWKAAGLRNKLYKYPSLGEGVRSPRNYMKAYWKAREAELDDVHRWAKTDIAIDEAGGKGNFSSPYDLLFTNIGREKLAIKARRQAGKLFQRNRAGFDSTGEPLDRLFDTSTGRSVVGEMQSRAPQDLPADAPAGAREFVERLNNAGPRPKSEPAPSVWGGDTGYEPYGTVSEASVSRDIDARPRLLSTGSDLFRSGGSRPPSQPAPPSRWGGDTGYE